MAAAVVVVVVAILEVRLRTDLIWPAGGIGLGILLGLGLMLRRSSPLLALVGALGLGQLWALAARLAGVHWVDLGVEVVVLAYVYSLFRWGSGREGSVGLVVMFLAWLQGVVAGSMESPGDVVGGGIVLLFPAVVGVAVRAQAQAQGRALDDVRQRERTRLARDLHDTVAHHVSAILMQARAGKAVATTRPAAAVGTLDAIEGAAVSALAELRDVVGALRDDFGDHPPGTASTLQDQRAAPAPRLPVRGLRDVVGLASVDSADGVDDVDSMNGVDDGADDGAALKVGPKVVVDVSAAFGAEGIEVRPAVDVAVYRLAQESVTNARRHAREVKRITVTVTHDDDTLILRVDDDGRRDRSRTSTSAGYGLVGMAERCALLGGSFSAGFFDDETAGGGWRVEARFPRSVRATEATSSPPRRSSISSPRGRKA